MRSKIGAVCSYFNPCHYRSRLSNYHSFKEALHPDVDLLTVELAFGDDKFELAGSGLLQLRTRDVMWQKERLLNIGIRELLHRGYDQICWLDADIIFQDDSWVDDLRVALDDWNICQLYSEADVPDINHGRLIPSFLKTRQGTGKTSTTGARCGFAWAARRSLFEQVALFDRAILGSGDTLMCNALFHQGDEQAWRLKTAGAPFWERLPPALLEDYCQWSAEWGRAVGNDFGYIDQSISTLFHGALVDRAYPFRYQLLSDFDPGNDIEIGPDHCWRWSSCKPEMHLRVREYFTTRQEDRSRNSVQG